MREISGSTEFSEAISQAYGIHEGFRLSFRIDALGNWPTSHSTAPRKGDQALVSHLRSLSDAIITGGNTARTENYRASKHAPILVISNQPETLDLPLFRDLGLAALPPLLVTSNQTLVGSSATALLNRESLEDPTMLQAEIQRILRERDYKHSLLETGPSLTKLLAPLIGEVCVTSPESTQVEPELGKLGFSRLDLRSDLRFDGQRFTRWVVTG